MLASRTFTEADQIRFADVSGDRNPMHLDAVKARRTQAGLPVVHGVHLLLWALDVLAREEPRAFADAAPEGELQAICRGWRNGGAGARQANRGERAVWTSWSRD